MPPIVQKQQPNRPSTNGQQTVKTNVLDRIKPIKKSNVGRLKFTFYGNPKTGKTRCAATFPKPLLIIGAEDGTASVVGVQGVDFVQIESTDEFKEIVNGPVKEGKYKTVVLDTATKLRDIRLSEITGNKNVMIQKSFGVAKREQFMECAQNMKEMLEALLDLPRLLEINIVIIAQEADLTKEVSGDTELVRPNIGPALGKSVSDYLCAGSDYICQTLIREQVGTTSKSIGGKNVEVVERTGRKEYCIRIGPHEVYYTGFRVPLHNKSIPDFIVNPTYEKIVSVIEGK